jgi:hypothetical protein
MWKPIIITPHLPVAEMWKELFDSEALPARIEIDPDIPEDSDAVHYLVMVSQSKDHIAAEILRKI